MPCIVYNRTNQCTIPKKVTRFPAGEILVNLSMQGFVYPRDHVNVILNFKNSDCIMELMQIADCLSTMPSLTKYLYIPYMPFARQDRRANEGDSHSLAVFARLVNSLGFDYIETDDPHSDVVEALFPTAKINRQWDIAQREVIPHTRPYNAVIAPDMGAAKKAAKVAEKMNVPMIQCTKVRDPETGKLSCPEIQGAEIIQEGWRLLVVDDICDGGYTFIQLIRALDEQLEVGVEVDLFVTHGIFSKGLAPLLDAGYNKIMCKNNMTNQN